MSISSRLSVLFCGYAPVHALCFLPLYERLQADPAIDVWFTGGFKAGHRPNRTYVKTKELYQRVGIGSDRVLSVEEASARQFDVLFSASTGEIVPLANAGSSVQIFHGVSMRNRGVRPENLRYDHLLLTGPFMRRLFDDLGILKADDSRGVPIGFPKTDRLIDGSLDRNLTLRRYGFDGTRPVLLYAPTGAEHNSMELFGPELIGTIARSNRFDLLVKPHDHPRNRLDQLRGLAPLESGHCRLVNDIDVIPLLHAADMLITDASSVANEFALLDRPLVYVDVPDVFSVTKEKGAFVDYDARSIGTIVRDPQDIVAGIMAELAEPDARSAKRRERAMDLFFNPGQATDTAAAWFYAEFVGSETRSAAK